MKISEPQSIQPIPAAQRTDRSAPTPEGGSFQDALQQAVAGSGSGRSTAPSTAAVLAPPAPVASIKPMAPLGGGTFVDRIDRMLDALDAYRHKLADHRCTLRDIEPLLKKIENGNRQLTEMQPQLPENNPLHGIVQELRVTASLEVVKFNRGDYV